MRATDTRRVRLGLRENLPQFMLLVAINALVGGMVGQERTVLPLLAEAEFGLTAYTAMLTFIAAFGLTKAVVNYFAGAFADRFGRKPVLLAGWLFAVPVPLLLIWAPTWGWVVFANVLLGVNQGLAWSVTVIMKIDLVGPTRRGTAMGFNEAAGYGAIALAAWATGAIADAAGLRPAPFLLGVAFAALGLGLSAVFVRETAGHVAQEAANHVAAAGGHDSDLTARQVFALGTWRDRSLSAASQAGLVNNLNEGMAWGLFPIFFAAGGADLATVGLLTAIAPAVWGIGQLGTGALSDRTGRKWLIAGGAARRSRRSAGHRPWRHLLRVGGRQRDVRSRHCNGLPDAHRRCGRRGPPHLAWRSRRCVPAVARRRLRRRRLSRRRAGRRLLHHRRHRRGRRHYRRQRRRRRRPHARHPSTPPRSDPP